LCHWVAGVEMGLFDRVFGRKTDPRQAFADRIIAGLRSGGMAGPITYDAEKFQLILDPGGQKQTAYLSNHFARYETTPEPERPAVLAHITRFILSAAANERESFEACRPQLLPSIRTRAEIEISRLELRRDYPTEVDMPFADLAGGLAVTLSIDKPDAIVRVMSDMLEGWSVSFDEALAIACDNLRARSHDLFERVGPDLYASPWRDSYDSARLLLPELFEQLSVRGRLLAMPAARERLLLTGSDTPQGLAAMAEMARNLANGMRPISAEILQWTGKSWASYALDPARPDHRDLIARQIEEAHQRYAQQKALLDAGHQQAGTDIFVASYQVMRLEGGRLKSYAVWGQGLDTLMPRVEQLMLMPAVGTRVIVAPWDVAWSLVGKYLSVTDFHPVRFRAREFPSETELAALAERPGVDIRHRKQE
jgi:hypothetical protein